MATKAEVIRRTNDIYKMILLGSDRAQILQYAIEKEWDVTDGMVDKYIRRARDEFIEQSTPIRAAQLGLALERANLLFQRNMKIQDYKAALAAQKEINNLIGLYPGKDHNINVNDWRSQAISDIKAGHIQYNELASLFDRDLATELFLLANVPVSVDSD